MCDFASPGTVHQQLHSSFIIFHHHSPVLNRRFVRFYSLVDLAVLDAAFKIPAVYASFPLALLLSLFTLHDCLPFPRASSPWVLPVFGVVARLLYIYIYCFGILGSLFAIYKGLYKPFLATAVCNITWGSAQIEKCPIPYLFFWFQVTRTNQECLLTSM